MKITNIMTMNNNIIVFIAENKVNLLKAERVLFVKSISS